jgi:hypothetical protein
MIPFRYSIFVLISDISATMHIKLYIQTGNEPPLWSSGQSSWLQIGDVLRFLWGTNRIYVCYVEESRPPLNIKLQTRPLVREGATK